MYCRLPISVHSTVIFEILAGLNAAPPGFIRLVPLDRIAQPLVERNHGLESQLGFDFRRVERIPKIMPWTVGYSFDHFLADTHQVEQRHRDSQIRNRLAVARPDVVDLPAPSMPKYKQQCPTVVPHVYPVADVQSLAVERYLFAFQKVRYEERDKFFRKLVGTVVVAAPSDHDR